MKSSFSMIWGTTFILTANPIGVIQSCRSTPRLLKKVLSLLRPGRTLCDGHSRIRTYDFPRVRVQRKGPKINLRRARLHSGFKNRRCS
jgi:hypothetical protein